MRRVSDGGPDSVSTRLAARIAEAIREAGGWLPFDRYMAMALYEPGLGYYARGSGQIGRMPSSGSDFVTAPELSPWFGAALARQVAQVLDAAASREVWEFGAGSGALAAQLLDALDALGGAPTSYTIVDLSGALRERQARTLARFGDRVRWVDALPGAMHGAVVGNEVLDAMPVQLLHWDGDRWHERGVALDPAGRRVWADRPTSLRPPVDAPFVPGTVTEIHLQAQAFVRTLADRLQRGAAILVDYGFPDREYYHPQRVGGTLMCHRGHRADADPLADAGAKDITAHVDFSAIALAAQDAGFEVAGYTSQAHFLVNCGLPALLAGADARAIADAQKLMTEHEMGELFKVLLLARGLPGFEPLGFVRGDRSHVL
jgi:SAM-dependent MidA family methyltransferase